jgi:hypothetical protein
MSSPRAASAPLPASALPRGEIGNEMDAVMTELGAIPSVIGLARLAGSRFGGSDIAPIYGRLAGMLAEDDSNVAPLMDIAILDQILGNPERALAIQAAALKARRVFALRPAGSERGLTLVGFAMAGAINSNTPIEFLIEDSDVTLITVYVVPGEPLPAVPEHDLAIVLAAESDAAGPVLAELERIVAAWPRPVLNRPQMVPKLGRSNLHGLLADVPGIAIPPTICAEATTVRHVAAGTVRIDEVLPGGAFPIIVRPLDSHAGRGLERVNRHAELADYLVRNPASKYFISRFVDYRSPDGMYRKYRVAVIDGVPYPSHLAISDHWMVHFLSAKMQEQANREEERHFMETFRCDFAGRHGAALAEMSARSGLEYFGIDCGETRDGRLLIFEADTALIVHNMDSPTEFPYKGPAMRELFAAFRAMLYRKVGTAPPTLTALTPP